MAKSKPKKRNKKNSQLNRSTRMARYGTSDLLLVFVGGKKETHVLDKTDGSYVNVGAIIADSFQSIAFKWSIYLAVLCRRQDGQEYIQSEEIHHQQAYRRNILEGKLNRRHEKLIESCNKLHIVNIAWIASTTPYQFNDEYCDKLLTSRDAWSKPSQWEVLRDE